MDARIVLRSAAMFLMDHAKELDAMAEASVTGGWSTHQVKRQREQAEAMRAKAGELYHAAEMEDLTI